MIAKELRELLTGVPDEIPILLFVESDKPGLMAFEFASTQASGLSEVKIAEMFMGEDEVKEKLQSLPNKVFILAPHSLYEESIANKT